MDFALYSSFYIHSCFVLSDIFAVFAIWQFYISCHVQSSGSVAVGFIDTFSWEGFYRRVSNEGGAHVSGGVVTSKS